MRLFASAVYSEICSFRKSECRLLETSEAIDRIVTPFAICGSVWFAIFSVDDLDVEMEDTQSYTGGLLDLTSPAHLVQRALSKPHITERHSFVEIPWHSAAFSIPLMSQSRFSLGLEMGHFHVNNYMILGFRS